MRAPLRDEGVHESGLHSTKRSKSDPDIDADTAAAALASGEDASTENSASPAATLSALLAQIDARAQSILAIVDQPAALQHCHAIRSAVASAEGQLATVT